MKSSDGALGIWPRKLPVFRRTTTEDALDVDGWLFIDVCIAGLSVSYYLVQDPKYAVVRQLDRRSKQTYSRLNS